MSAPSRPPLPRTSPAPRRRITVGILLASVPLGLIGAGVIAPASAQDGSRLCASAFVSTVKGFEPNVTYVRLVEVAKNRIGGRGYELCNQVRFDGTTYPGWTKSASYNREGCERFSADVLAWDTLDVVSSPAYDYDGRDVCRSMQRSAIWIAKIVADPATGARRLTNWSQDWPPQPPPAAR
jgi:hypothetical protein